MIKSDLRTLLMKMDYDERDYIIESLFNSNSLLYQLCQDWNRFQNMKEFLLRGRAYLGQAGHSPYEPQPFVVR